MRQRDYMIGFRPAFMAGLKNRRGAAWPRPGLA